MSDTQYYFEYGLRRAKIELESDDPFFPAPDDVGTVLKYVLAEMLTDAWGSVEAIRRHVRAGELTRREVAAAARERLAQLLPAPFPVTTPARIIDLAVDAMLSERLCPELRLADAARDVPQGPVHALVFSAFPHVANELYPLMIDAYVAGLESGTPVQVMGVHESWLAGGAIRRAILFSEESLGLIEADLHDPVMPRTAQALALNLAEEQACHARIEQALADIPLLNPSAGARRLDDKAETAAIWQRAGLPTPAFLLLDEPTDAREALEHFAVEHGPALVVKPADGTEGRGVELVDFSIMGGRERAFRTLADINPSRVIVAVQHGSLRYAGPDGPVRCTVRLNVCWDGAHAWTESGYAQVATAPTGIASAGRGGRLVTLTELWTHLCHPDGTPYTPTSGNWRRLLDAAIAGVEALGCDLGAEMPALIGIDVLLDEDDDVLKPILLEANPRPAGLSHSRLFTSAGPDNDPGVSLRLWKVVKQLGASEDNSQA